MNQFVNKNINKSQFLNALSPYNRFDILYNNLPGILFFMKNRKGEFVLLNQVAVEALGFQKEEEVVGKTDFDIFPRDLSEGYHADDLLVMEEAQVIENRPELAPNRYGQINWVATSKIPLYDQQGKIIGLAGMCQSFKDSRKSLKHYLDISKAIEYIETHYKESIKIDDLADAVNMSVRQLERKFKETLLSSPRGYIIKTRTLASCELLLKTNASIAEIALEIGFYDQSSFSRYFRKHIGTSPARYRRQYL